MQDIAAIAGIQTSSATLTIKIEDENDNNPKFQKPFYKRIIPENSQNGVPIVTVLANDIDKNKTINYTLEGSSEISDLIYLDSVSGEIVVANKIDHEQYHWLNFSVRATDSGVPTRSSLVEIFIQIIDENDNNPYFIGDITNITVYENSPIGHVITTIEAEDADSGDYGKISYLIDRISSHGKFAIDIDTGALMIANIIDREVRDSYMIVIEAWDNYQFGYISKESRNAFKQIL